jgi:hypothetical protein
MQINLLFDYIFNMWQMTYMNENLRKYAQIKGLTKGTGLALSKLTGIDKSTVSLHLTGHRKMSIEHAKKYGESLDVPYIKLLDDNIIKYPVVGYVELDGSVRMRKENEIDICIADNDIASSNCYALFQQRQEVVFFYNPKNSCKNTNTINSYCYIKSKKQNLLGSIVKETKKSAEVYNVHTNKTSRISYDICYPIVSIFYLKHSNLHKIQGEY